MTTIQNNPYATAASTRPMSASGCCDTPLLRGLVLEQTLVRGSNLRPGGSGFHDVEGRIVLVERLEELRERERIA